MSQLDEPGATIRRSSDFNAGIVLIAVALLGPAVGAFLQYYGVHISVERLFFLPIRFAFSLQVADGIRAGSYFLPLGLIGLAVLIVPVRNQQDFYGGVGLVALALIAFMASRNLPGTQGFAFGPGTAPRLFAGLLLLAGFAVTVMGLVTDGPRLQRYAIRGPLIVTAAVILFANAVRPFGLVISAYVTVVLAASASDEVRWIETLIWAAALTVFCALLFRYGLNLPLQLWPRGYWGS